MGIGIAQVKADEMKIMQAVQEQASPRELNCIVLLNARSSKDPAASGHLLGTPEETFLSRDESGPGMARSLFELY